MDLTRLGLTQRLQTVVILGAGSTAGAGLHPTGVGGPFVDADFFHKLRLANARGLLRGLESDVEDLLALVAQQYGPNGAGMETVFADLETHHDFLDEIAGGGGPRDAQRFKRAQEAFTRIIPALLDVLVKGDPNDNPSPHLQVLAEALRARDAVISFNYDTVMDEHLVRFQPERWDPAVSFGFSPISGLEAWRSGASSEEIVGQPILLLKPHGSLSWVAEGDRTRLVEPHPARRDDRPLIVPPQPAKKFSHPDLKSVWTRSRETLRGAAALLIIGYSLPTTDAYTTAALRLDLDEVAFLGIVNPDPSARARILATLRSSINDSTVVLELERFEDLTRLLI
jgi:hypothetical protein